MVRPALPGRSDHLVGSLAANARDLLGYFERRAEREDAADLVAETMLAAWRRVDDLPADDEGARRWLFGIARNVLLNSQRTTRRRSRLAARLRDVLASAPVPAVDESTEVRDAIGRLDPPLAEIVQLVHWEGLSLADAAEVLGIPSSTARSRYQRAKEELRRTLAAEIPVSSRQQLP